MKVSILIGIGYSIEFADITRILRKFQIDLLLTPTAAGLELEIDNEEWTSEDTERLISELGSAGVTAWEAKPFRRFA